MRLTCRIACTHPAIFGTRLPVIPQAHGRRSQMASSNLCEDPWRHRSNKRTTLYASADGVGASKRFPKNRRPEDAGHLAWKPPLQKKAGSPAGRSGRRLKSHRNVEKASVDRVDRHLLDPRRCDKRADLQLAKRKRHGVQLRISLQKRDFELASTSKSGAVVLSDRETGEEEAKQ